MLLNILKKYNINFSDAKGILVEGIVVGITEYLMLGGFVLVNFLINKYYGTQVVGIYFLSYSIAQIGILGVGSAFSLLMRRDLGINKYDCKDYLFKVQLLRFGNLLAVLFLSTAFIVLFYQLLFDNLLFILLMVGAKGFDSLSESYYTAYQTLNRIKEYSFFKILNAVSFVFISVIVCLNKFDIGYLYWSQLICAVLIFTINFYFWHKAKNLLSSTEEKKLQNVSYKFLVVESYPLIINALVFQLGLRANNLLIFDMLGDKNLGIFSLVLITVSVFAGVANTLAIVFFGRLTKIFIDNRDGFLLRLHQTIIFFVVIGLLFLAVYLVCVQIMVNVFGMNVDNNLYPIMSAAIPFMFVASCLGMVFTIIKKQKTGMFLAVVILIFNLAIYYFTIRQYNLVGAGYAFLISALFQSVVIYFGALVTIKSILKTDVYENNCKIK
jgi:O-antigen/teichoic acid export membrane protein